MRGLAAIAALGSSGATQVSNDDDSVFGSGTTLVDFNAIWCGPCRRQGPNVEDLAAEFPGQVFKVDVDANPRLADKYDTHSIPTLIVFKDGQEIIRHQGIHSKDEMKQWMGGTPDGSSWVASTASTPQSSPPAQASYSNATSSSFPQGDPGPSPGSGWQYGLLDGRAGWYRNDGRGNQWVFPGQSAPVDQSTMAPAATPPVAPPVSVPSPVYSSRAATVVQPPDSASVAYNGQQKVSTNVSANPTDWSYVLAHGNRKWQAVLVDGQQKFWDGRGTDPSHFVSSIVGMNGLRGLGITGSLGVVNLPVKSFTTQGGGVDLKTAGLILGGVAVTGVVGYALYRMLK